MGGRFGLRLGQSSVQGMVSGKVYCGGEASISQCRVFSSSSDDHSNSVLVGSLPGMRAVVAR